MVAVGSLKSMQVDSDEGLEFDDEAFSGSDGGRSKGRSTAPARRPGGKGGARTSVPKQSRPGQAAVGRGKARAQKGKKWCRGCATWLPMELFAENQALHFACKGARDNVQRIARRQKMLDWFASVEADDNKLMAMIANYNDRTPIDPQTGKRVRAKIVCAVLKTAIEAATELLKDDVGEMMCEPEFIDWSKTPKGGMLDVNAAKLKWNDMMKNKAKMISDEKGPERYPTRFRISVKDLVTFRERVSALRIFEMQGRQVKNPDDAQMQKMTNSVMTGQGMDMRCAVADQDFDELARNMVRAGGSCSTGEDDGFLPSLQNGLVGNVKDLVPDGDSDDQVNKDESDGDFADDGASKLAKGGNQPKGAKPRKSRDGWLDENTIHKAQRAWRTAVGGIKKDFASVKVDSDAILKTIADAKLQNSPHFRNSLALVERRADAGNNVLAAQPHKLSILRASYIDPKPVPSGPSAAASSMPSLEPPQAATSESAKDKKAGDQEHHDPAKDKKAGNGEVEDENSDDDSNKKKIITAEDKKDGDDDGTEEAAAEAAKALAEAEEEAAKAKALAGAELGEVAKAEDGSKQEDTGGKDAVKGSSSLENPSVGTSVKVDKASGSAGHKLTEAKVSSKSPSASTMSIREALRSAPPCPKHQDLRTIDQLLAMADEYMKVQTASDIKDTTLRLAQFKTAARQLLAAWKAAVSELTVAYTGWKKAAEEADKAPTPSKRPNGAAGGTPRKKGKKDSLIELVVERGQPLVSVSYDMLTRYKADGMWQEGLEVPPILQGCEDTEGALPYVVTGVSIEFEDDVRSALESFTSDFTTSDVRSKRGRAMRVNESDDSDAAAAADSFLLAKMLELCPAGSIVAPGVSKDARMAPLRENMVLYSFGVKGGSRHSSIEKGTGWFGRLVTAGTRSLIAVKALGVIQYMRSKSILGIDAKDYMRDLTADAFRTMMADGAVEVFHVTTGPGDFMWIPPGIVVLETVMEKDCFGLRFGCLCKKDKDNFAIFNERADSPATPDSDASKLIVETIAKATIGTS